MKFSKEFLIIAQQQNSKTWQYDQIIFNVRILHLSKDYYIVFHKFKCQIF